MGSEFFSDDLPHYLRKTLTPEQRAVLQEGDVQKVLQFLNAAAERMLTSLVDLVIGYRQLLILGVPREEIKVDIPYIEQMAVGQVLPELVTALFGKKALMRVAVGLPLGDQLTIAKNEPIKVLEIGGDFRMVPALALTPRQIEQVFDESRLRTEVEQAQYLSDLAKEQSLPAPETEPIRYGRNKVDILRPLSITNARWIAIAEDLKRRKRKPKSE